MAENTCSVDACGKVAHSRGWCTKHYQRWRKNGDPLLSRAPVPMSPTCLTCGAVNPQKGPTGPQAAYCSRSCQSRASYLRRMAAGTVKRQPAPAKARETRNCDLCNAQFLAKQERSQACSKKCSRKLAQLRQGTCRDPECERAVKAAGLCSTHYRAQHPNASTWSKGLPETRRANLRRKTQQRRARIKGDALAELIDRDAIGDRDGWLCGLCSARVDRTLAYPHLKSASLDHIVPLSRGGKHLRSNVQISHLDCNMAKGNRAADVQPLLVG